VYNQPNKNSAYGIPDPILQRAEALGHAFDATCRPAIGNDEATAVMAPAPAPAPPTAKALTLEGAAAVLQRVAAGGYEQPDAALAQVAPGFDPSPALEGQACVYLLRVPAAAGSASASAASFYVGETESVRRRLEQHRCVLFFQFKMSKRPISDSLDLFS
jgi:hypothetical protein